MRKREIERFGDERERESEVEIVFLKR